MKKIPIEPGRAVLSIAGRDSGRRFIALKVEGDYAFIADGDLRKAEKPKKKKAHASARNTGNGLRDRGSAAGGPDAHKRAASQVFSRPTVRGGLGFGQGRCN